MGAGVGRRRLRILFSAFWAASVALAALPAGARAIALCELAPNFRAYEVVREQEFDFQTYRKGSITLFWVWDWGKGCPI